MHISTPVKLFTLLVIFSFNNVLTQAQSFVEETVTVPGVAGGASWGDYDRDGNLDLITTGSSGGLRTTSIFKNNGNSTFTQQSTFVLKGLSSSYVDWGDYNNDGFLDVLLNGYTGSGYFSAIYKNGAGTSFTEQTQIPLLDVSDGNLTFCDYNNDGYKDVLVTGYNGSYNTKLYKNNKGEFIEQTGIAFDQISDSYASWGDYNNDGFDDLLLIGGHYYSSLYKNNGNGTFSKQSISITAVNECSSAWGDYNNDGYLDFIITGKNSSGYYSQIYKNNGNGTFSLQPIALPGVAYSSVAWGDYDNDGDLDLLLAGVKSATFTDCITKLYKNNNDNTFTEVTDFSMKAVGFANVQFVDYNKDSKLDISVCGSDGNGTNYFKLYKNTLSTINTASAIPTNLTTGISGTDITFKWDKSIDTETPQSGLSYNLYLYKDGVTEFAKAADAFTQTLANNGKRLISKLGNIQYNTEGYKIDASTLPSATYKWSVQAVDGALIGSPFATEQTIAFTIHNNAKDLVADPSGMSMRLSWKSGNGDKCIVIAKENASETFDPLNNTIYAANAAYGITQMGTSGWYCVYNGTGNTVTVTGLKTLTNYSFRVIDYIGSAGAEQYYTEFEASASLTKSTSLFTPISSFGKMTTCAVAWCDYDNDGDLDYVASGLFDYTPLTKLYRNDGSNTFTVVNAGFPDLYHSSVSWGDYDNDGYADLAILGQYGSNGLTKVYHNNKNGSFTELVVTLPGYYEGNITWGDYNNDGFADLFLCGTTNKTAFFAKIYLNTKNNSFVEQSNINITGVNYSSAMWVDLDNDADLDLLVSGNNNSNYVTKIYRNDGNGSFIELTGITLSQVEYSSIDAGDYDSDGDLDLLLTGGTYKKGDNDTKLTKVYKNDGNFTFIEQTTIALPGVIQGSSKWVDYDNDGDLDIILNGEGVSNSKIYKNTSNVFTEETNIILPGTDWGSLVWGDYDNDSDLDLILTGSTGPTDIGTIYRNDVTAANVIPAAPTGLSATSDGVLSWTAVSGDATSSDGLTYSVRVGTASGKSDIVSPLSSATGFRRIPVMGNAQTGTDFKLNNLKKGTYYWSVQAIDNSLAGGAFAAEQTFNYNADYPASSLKITNIKTSSLKCSWTRGNGDKCVLFVKENGTGTATPVNNTTYTADKVFPKGTEIVSTGWRCVFNGTGDSITISGLKPNTSYAFHVIEYSSAALAEKYYTANEITAHISQTTDLYTELTGTTFPNVYAGTVSWGDYDNDDDLDVLLTGDSGSGRIAKIYNNNGNSTFTEQTGIALTGVSVSSTEWSDFDNDGDLDILLVGYTGSVRIATIYINNGNNTFTEKTGLNLTGVSSAKVACADYDNDGYMDFLLTGYTETGNVSKIYRNNGNNTFTEQTTISLTGVYDASIAWGDYDNDNDPDIFLSGFTGYNRVSKIYKNNGNGTFTEQTSIVLPKVAWGDAAWGDYDSDGDLDLLFSGYNGTDRLAFIYKNNGDNTFTTQNSILKGVQYGSSIWGDYDNDGDLDILLAGTDGYNYFTKVYRNEANSFSEQSYINLPGGKYISAKWGDYDKDGDLDILLSGDSGSGYFTKIYRNTILNPNTVPVAPANLTATVGIDVKLQWSPVISDATPEKGMTYNIRVGKTSGAGDLISAMSNSTNGFSKLVAMGNVQQNTSVTLKNLKHGTYFWSVQAVDNNFAGGVFATEQSFVYDTEVQAKDLKVVPGKTATSVFCSWTRGNGDKCAVFAKEEGSGTAAPVNNTAYPGSKDFNAGTPIGSTDWHCLYNGVLDTATIYNLNPNKEYRFQVIEYYGNSGAETYYMASGTNNPTQIIPKFIEQTQIVLTGVSGSTQAWGDYDNDGDLDLVVGGYTGTSKVAEIYKNNGDNTFTKVPVSISNTYFIDDLQWGDFDNDGDLDLLVLTDAVSSVYENKGDGTFAAGISLPTISGGIGQWADLNNDGYKDIIFTNMGFTRILQNNKDKTFSQTIDLQGASNSPSIACGDYDNDGDLDVLLAGLKGSAEFTKVFRNDGNFVFTEQTAISLPGISNCDVKWADMDNDGDLDIVLSGAAYNLYTRIYDNNGNNTFTEITGTPFVALYRSSIGIADYDNDGYRDLVVSGSTDGDDYLNYVYHNNGNKTYSLANTVAFPGTQFGTIAFGDYDKDGDLDMFTCGTTASGRISKIFRNNLNTVNAPPAAPAGIVATSTKNDVKFTWNKPLDDKTSGNGLSYNLYLYEVSKAGYQVSPDAFKQTHASNGLRLLASQGDIRYSTSGYTLKGIPAGNYKWSIQAVDAGLKGGLFAAEGSFTIADLSAIAVNVAEGQITGTISGLQYSINSTDGTNGLWNSSASPNTTVNFGTGGFDVWVRQVGNITNNRKLCTVAPQQSAPTYGIDFVNETTDKIVPATDEYSVYSGMSNAIAGSDNTISIIPGQTLFMRTKATATAVASAIQSISVNGRYLTPTIRINYSTEKTLDVIPAGVEYSSSPTMSNPISGTGIAINLIPGQTIYFRAKADVVNKIYKSPVQTLNVDSRPSVPSFEVDYENELTSSAVSSAYEYSVNEDMSNAISGTGSKVSIVAGQSLYFRVKATSTSFKSDIQEIWTMYRPNTPAFTIAYSGETTTQSLSSNYEYSGNANMSNSKIGTGEKIPVVPGQNLYIRIKATNNSFKSGTYTLVVPARPVTPAYTIDYNAESTAETVSSAYEYSNNQDMSNSNNGADNKITVVPGQNLYIRTKATTSAFKSGIQSLILPARPDAPSNMVIDDGINTCDWSFAPGFYTISDYEYSINGGTSWTTCSIKPINVGSINITSGTLKLRIKTTANRFCSNSIASTSAFTTSITSLNEAGITMFPNPAEDVLNLENLPEKSWISIYNLNGKLLKEEYYEEKKVEISVVDLTPGLYFIKIKTQKGESQAKFSKL